MAATPNRTGQQLQRFLERDQQLRRWTWFSLIFPLGIFVVLVVMVGREMAHLAELRQQDNDLQIKIGDKEKKLTELQQKQNASELAVTAVKNTRPEGALLKIMYYRDVPNLQAALDQLGIKRVQENYAQANPTLAKKPADTLAYGCAVSEQDLRLIAAALIQAGVPIRRVTPAEKKQDPLLVQLIASIKTDSSKPPLDPAQLKITAKRCPLQNVAKAK